MYYFRRDAHNLFSRFEKSSFHIGNLFYIILYLVDILITYTFLHFLLKLVDKIFINSRHIIWIIFENVFSLFIYSACLKKGIQS